jgi:zinc D-Ala-D-Ala dipeptidase
MLRRLIVFVALAFATALAQRVPQTFKVQPLRPVAELRDEALKAHPPVETGEFLKPDLIELVQVDSTLKLDIHYASSNNFLGTPVYAEARAFMQRPAAEAVARANRKLHEQGYGLLIFDGYRPWYVTKMFWDATTEKEHPYLADPAAGSRHNRGCAVDLTLYDLKSREPVSMPSTYDDFSESAQPSYPGGTAEQRAHREFLRKTMEAEGFTVYPTEWWHFDYKEWRNYPILNVPFSQLSTQGR